LEIFVNGKLDRLTDAATVAGMLELRQLAGRPVAVEVNGQLVRRRDHTQHHLRPGDRVEIVTLVGGG
jgi:thiamine biosynthesis protein ThiS